MTAVLGIKPGHDGALAFVADGDLVYSLEGEKDSFERYSPVTAQLLVDALTDAPEPPDVIALGGWHKTIPGTSARVGAGYHGIEPGELQVKHVFGRRTYFYTSSHERSHLYSGVSMSGFNPEEGLVVLVWEGVLGAFYRWHGPRKPIDRVPVLDQPGARYASLYLLADPSCPDSGAAVHGDNAGKLMALAGCADESPPSRDSIRVVDALLRMSTCYPFDKAQFRDSALYNCGFVDPEFCRAARYTTSRLFEIYHSAAVRLLEPGHPLVVVGGSGLNCDWNSSWRNSDHFSDVFVPPVANDTGSAIGTAVDASVQLGGDCTLRWDVYRGARFADDVDPREQGWAVRPLDYVGLSDAIDEGRVVAWVQGRCEIGPRALGHRSLLASAADERSRDVLNELKQREPYRPIAPACLEEDLGYWFDRDHPDPHMLYFRMVRDRHRSRIPAVVHADGSARVQSVAATSSSRLHELLLAHRHRTGVGVLCNTSLNFKGAGFINRMSDLLSFCTSAGIEHVVVEDRWYTR